jgi:uncharacterized membrane protein YphA (DoxX/SURF4 family)
MRMSLLFDADHRTKLWWVVIIMLLLAGIAMLLGLL